MLGIHNTMEPLVLFLFGKSGTGKSFVGDILEEILGWHVYHADKDITEEMKAALSENRPFTNDMRDRYFSIVAENILARKEIYRNIVVTQGVYKKKHRDILVSNVPDLELVHIQSTNALIQERLLNRKDGISLASAAALTNDFEEPDESIKTIINNGTKTDVARQLSALAKQIPNKFSQQDAAKLRLC
jgi:gluconokinase